MSRYQLSEWEVENRGGDPKTVTLTEVSMETWQVLLSSGMGALASGIPLYIKLRSALTKIKSGEHSLETKILTDEHDLDKQKQIDSEAEWKRILEFRDLELQRLRDRDEQQERQLTELRTQNLDCVKRDAKNEERILHQGNEIQFLKQEILELKSRLRPRRGRRHDDPKEIT